MLRRWREDDGMPLPPPYTLTDNESSLLDETDLVFIDPVRTGYSRFATRYTFNHLGLDPALSKNLTLDDYTAGHMMYLNQPDLKKQKADLAKFSRAAAPH